MSPKPTIILVPGAWHKANSWGPLQTLLEKDGYPTVALTLPSTCVEPPVETMHPDTNHVREVLEKTLENTDAVVVGHSYAGFPMTEAVKGYAKKDREGRTHVVALVYVTAFLRDVGESQMSTIGYKTAPWVRTEGRKMFVAPEPGFDYLYNDLPSETSAALHAALDFQATGAWETPLTYAGWRDIPPYYFRCEDDLALPAAYQDWMIDAGKEALGEDGLLALQVQSFKTGHSPMLSRPEWVAEFVGRAARLERVNNKLT